jgi:phosphohistidine swiveling domain-containing protein
MLQLERIEDRKQFVGPKALRLVELYKAGFPVPAFVVLDTQEVSEILSAQTQEEKDRLKAVCLDINISLPVKTYAVRSAALVEDGSSRSYAGQFQTLLGVTTEGLAAAILSVANDAKEKLPGSNNFSIIIQEYITPDFAGVIFTRNPLGGREMVMEYRIGSGEAVVGGKSVSRKVFLLEAAARINHPFPQTLELVSLASTIEQKYMWPQDIEWAVSDGVVYILQTRPVTSMSDEDWRGIKYLDQKLKQQTTYVYERSSQSETFFRPKPLAFSMLEALYKKDGPIEQAYANLGITYQETSQIQQFGNEVFIDREAEIKSLFPALGYIKNQSSWPRLVRSVGLMQTIHNWLAVIFVLTRPNKKLQDRVRTLLTIDLSEQATFIQRWECLLMGYVVIFEVNLRAQKAVQKLEQALGEDANQLASLLVFTRGDIQYPDGLIGNSLSVDDITPFKAGGANGEDNERMSEWLEGLPQWRQRGLRSYIKNAQHYALLREQARWASVRLATYVRTSVESQGNNGISADMGLLYFATLDEMLAGEISIRKCIKRESQYVEYQKMTVPGRVTSFETKKKSEDENTGLSPGEAAGVLVGVSEVVSTAGSKILLVQTLSPDLTAYFDDIDGIVAEQGGLLSHLAIMAREANIPVVITNQKLTRTQTVHINGTTGEIILS